MIKVGNRCGMTRSRGTGRETITFDLNEPFPRLVYATKRLEDEHPYRAVWGIVDLSHPIFNFRGEYDKLDEYDGQVGGEGINDTGVMSMEARVR